MFTILYVCTCLHSYIGSVSVEEPRGKEITSDAADQAEMYNEDGKGQPCVIVIQEEGTPAFK